VKETLTGHQLWKAHLQENLTLYIKTNSVLPDQLYMIKWKMKTKGSNQYQHLHIFKIA